MPEGHVLHRLANRINERFAGRLVGSASPQGRFGDADLLNGRTLSAAEAWGKHLFVDFSHLDVSVHVHLGLYGSLRFRQDPDAPIEGQVRWRLSNEQWVADLRGPNSCVLMDAEAKAAKIAQLGPDPIRGDADRDRFIDRVARSRASIAVLLMDQKVVAGVGNVYRAEVLFRHRIAPLTPGREIPRESLDAIWEDLVDLMRLGVSSGRIDTVLPEHEPEAMGRPARDDDHGGEVYVYRRAGFPCHVCGNVIATEVVSGRNLFWCPSCQEKG